MFEKILQSRPLLTHFVRNYGKQNKHVLFKDGKRCGGVIYYPREANHEDPPITPSKLFRVQRIKPVKGNTRWEKQILKEFKLDGRNCDFAIVKNTPQQCGRLWKIKHIVKIVPIVFPYGEPTANDLNYTFLKENGECLVTKEIKVDESRIEATKQFIQNPRRLDSETLIRDSRMKWLNPF